MVHFTIRKSNLVRIEIYMKTVADAFNCYGILNYIYWLYFESALRMQQV